jgi:uncharacterized protein YpmB
MSLLIFILLLSVILVVINPSIAMALNASNKKPDNNTYSGGLSTESNDIAEANNKTDLINGKNSNNGTDLGGLSARSVNISK